MFDSSPIQDALAKITAKRQARRRFFSQAAIAGAAGVAGLSVLGANPLAALAQTTVTDNDIFNFALNLEYLEAEFYLRATTGAGLPDAITTGTGTRGDVTGGSQVTFTSEAVRQYANEIASDEMAHVRFFRTTLGAAAVARPAINLRESFIAAGNAAGVANFNPFADENSFLLGAFLFEDVGVTAFKGAAPLISSKTNLENAAGVLAVEAYHAGLIRTVLFARGLGRATNQISDARDSLDGTTTDDDQGILNTDGTANIVPTDANGVAYSRTAGQVLNVVYLTPQARTNGGFFPNGVNGTINTSAANG